MYFLFVTLIVPESCEELKSLLLGKSTEDQLLVVERIQKCNHPSLAVGNKAKLEVCWPPPGAGSGRRPGNRGARSHRVLTVFVGAGRARGCGGSPSSARHESTLREGAGSGCWACSYPLPVTPRTLTAAGPIAFSIQDYGVTSQPREPRRTLRSLPRGLPRIPHPTPTALDTPGLSRVQGRASWVGLWAHPER